LLGLKLSQIDLKRAFARQSAGSGLFVRIQRLPEEEARENWRGAIEATEDRKAQNDLA
jgi:hypothetical protein